MRPLFTPTGLSAILNPLAKLGQIRRLQCLLKGDQCRITLGATHLLATGTLLLGLNEGQRRLLLLPARIRPRLQRLQQRHPITQPRLRIVALEAVGIDHRLPISLHQ